MQQIQHQNVQGALRHRWRGRVLVEVPKQIGAQAGADL
jgi:hypothetical protein